MSMSNSDEILLWRTSLYSYTMTQVIYEDLQCLQGAARCCHPHSAHPPRSWQYKSSLTDWERSILISVLKYKSLILLFYILMNLIFYVVVFSSGRPFCTAAQWCIPFRYLPSFPVISKYGVFVTAPRFSTCKSGFPLFSNYQIPGFLKAFGPKFQVFSRFVCAKFQVLSYKI